MIYLNIIEPFIWVAWDLLAVLIIFHCVYKCARKGLLSTVVKSLCYIGAAFAAGSLYLKLSSFLYDNVVRTFVKQTLTRNFNQMLSYGSSGTKNTLEAIPVFLKLLLGDKRSELAGIPISGEADVLAVSVIDTFLKTPLTTLLHGITFLVVFAVVSFCIKWLANLFISVNHIPIIGWLNVLLGGILGVFVSGVTLFIAAFVIRLAVTISEGGRWWLNSGVMEATYIWRVFWT